MTKPKVTPFDAADYLTSDEAIAEYLTAAAEGGEAAHIAQAMGTVVRARNLSQLARDTGMTGGHAPCFVRRGQSKTGYRREDTRFHRHRYVLRG